MKIKNQEWSTRVISLPGGRSLTLAGRGSDEISAEDFDSPEVKRLVKTGAVIVLPEKKSKPADDAAKEPSHTAARKEPGQHAAGASSEGAPAEESQ